MIRRCVAIAVVMMAAGMYPAASVVAQVTDTPTVTPAEPGIITTPTPIPLLDTSCPSGVPYGWGTVTPGPLWLSLCARCLSPSTATIVPAYATATAYAATATAMVATPVPSPTVVTPTPANILLDTDCSGYKCTPGRYSGSCVPSAGTPSVSYTCSYDMWVPSSGGANYSYLTYRIWPGASGQTLYWSASVYTGSGGRSKGSLMGLYGDACVVGAAGSYSYSGSWSMSRAVEPDWYISCARPVTAHLDVVFSSSPLPSTSTPYPTSSPGTGYCTVVDPGSPAYGYTGLRYGSMVCIDVGPGEWIGLSLPHVAHVCLRDLDIGAVTVLGMQISLASIVYIISVVAIISIATRK